MTTKIYGLSNNEESLYSITNPGVSAAVTAAIVDAYSGVNITTTTTGNAQTIQSPSDATLTKTFLVVNNDTSTNTIAVNGITIPVGKCVIWTWDGTAWNEIGLGITSIPVTVDKGGSGRATATAYAPIIGGTTTTGAHQSVALGSEGQVLTFHGAGAAPTAENAPSGTVPDSGSDTTVILQGAGDGTWDVKTPEEALGYLTNPLSHAQGINVVAATSGSNGIAAADDDDLDMATNNFGFACTDAIPDITPAAIIVLAQKTDGTNGWNFQLLTTGYLRLTINVTNYDSTATLASMGFSDGDTLFPHFSVTRESASVAGSVVFGVNGFQCGASVAITAGAPTTVSNAALFYALGTSATRTAGTTIRNILTNFAPTIAEWRAAFLKGVPESWKWGSQTELVTNGGFDADTDWTKQAAWTIAAGVAHYDDSAIQYISQSFNYSGDKVAGVRFTISGATGSVKIAITNTYSGGAFIASLPAYTTLAGNGTYVYKENFLAAGDGIRFYGHTDGSAFDLDNISVLKLGATLDLEPDSWQADKPYDLSSNNNVCSYPATGWTLTGPPELRFDWPTATAKTTAATLTIAELLTLTITGTHAAGATQAYTLPVGTLCEAWPAFQTVRAFEWSLINLSANAVDTITLTAGDGHTIVGNPIVQSAHSSTGGVYGNSARFRTQRTALNTFVTTRIA